MSMSVGGCGGNCGTGQTQQSQKSGGLQELMQALFNQVDTDCDGSISQTEFSSLMSQSTASGQATSATNTSDLFKSIDSDGDGQISLSEFKKFAGGMFASQVGAASGNSWSSSTFGISGMLGKVTQAAEDLFKGVFGDGSSLPPGATATASVHATMFENGGFMVSASVSETMTQSLVNAQTGQVVSSNSFTSTATAQMAAQSYGHHHHHGGGLLQQLMSQLDNNGDGSISTSELATALSGGTGTGGSATA
jgi:Ca2+-binding EF-hand superfamily protein